MFVICQLMLCTCLSCKHQKQVPLSCPAGTRKEVANPALLSFLQACEPLCMHMSFDAMYPPTLQARARRWPTPPCSASCKPGQRQTAAPACSCACLCARARRCWLLQGCWTAAGACCGPCSLPVPASLLSALVLSAASAALVPLLMWSAATLPSIHTAVAGRACNTHMLALTGHAAAAHILHQQLGICAAW